jgi:hypothetical protein
LCSRAPRTEIVLCGSVMKIPAGAAADFPDPLVSPAI